MYLGNRQVPTPVWPLPPRPSKKITSASPPAGPSTTGPTRCTRSSLPAPFSRFTGARQAVDAQGRDMVEFLGYTLPGSSLLTYAISVAFLVIALISPFLTSLADYSGRKKLFLQIFCYLGAASCAGLYFFTKDTLTLSTFVFIAATVGFSGSIVFYNSYLPEISSEAKFDSLSAKGFSMGYIGSVLLLVICLGIIQGPEILGGPKGVALFGMTVGQATRLSFLLTGIWWVGFAQIPFFTLPPDTGRPADAPASADGWLLNGFRELGKVWDQLKQLPNLKRFLLAYFTYNMGVQTVMYVATIFGDKVLHARQHVADCHHLAAANRGHSRGLAVRQALGAHRQHARPELGRVHLDAHLHRGLLRAGRLELLRAGRRHRPHDGRACKASRAARIPRLSPKTRPTRRPFSASSTWWKSSAS
ncbi:MAG: MFS transporter [Hymenobacter sp.]